MPTAAYTSTPAPESTNGNGDSDGQNHRNRNRNRAVQHDDSVFQLGRYSFKEADTLEEYEEVHRLNYETFVREIAQHEDTGSNQLIDKFHNKNLYFIAKRNGKVAGMVAVNDQPPFSTQSRLPHLDLREEFGNALLEIRLLAVQPGERNSLVFAGLIWTLYNHALKHGYTHMVISGVADRVSLYEKLGFRAIGESVVQGGAIFVPMVMEPRNLPDKARAREPMWTGKMKRAGSEGVPMNVVDRAHTLPNGFRTDSQDENNDLPLNIENGETAPNGKLPSTKSFISFLPGPVQIDPRVTSAFAAPPISHRDVPFINRFERTRRILSELVGGFQVAMVPGSGTLANDIIASNLAADREIGRGIVLVNGEFGHRLVDQVERVGLDADTVEWQWAHPWDFDQIRATLEADQRINWIWGVHLESSTGMVNDIQGLRRCTDGIRRKIKICADCISSLGAIPINPQGLHMVSGASGKSLGSYAGVALVFAQDTALDSVDSHRIPNYYDLKAWIKTAGPRFTFPSPTLLALDAALDSFATAEARNEKFIQYQALGQYVRKELRRLGIRPLVDGAAAAPVITTFDAPFGLSCEDFLDCCRSWGYELSGLSGYLETRSWAQIATMGNMTIGDCIPFFSHFEAWLLDYKKRPPAKSGETSVQSA